MQAVDTSCQHSYEVNEGMADIGKIVGSYIESEDISARLYEHSQGQLGCQKVFLAMPETVLRKNSNAA
jgi:hypothetical protein